MSALSKIRALNQKNCYHRKKITIGFIKAAYKIAW